MLLAAFSPIRLRAAVDAGLVLLLALLPFELVRALRLPVLALTNVEMVALLTCGAWAALLAVERRRPRSPRWLGVSAAAVIATLLLSALLADWHRGEPLKFCLRQGQGALLALCLAERVAERGWELGRLLLPALAGGGLLSAALGLWELGHSPIPTAILDQFRTTTTMMGGILRLSASFLHANIAGMYFEALLPLLMAGALGLAPGRWRWAAAGGAALLWAACLHTYSRASVITGLLMCGVIGAGAAWRFGRSARTWRALALAGALAGGLAALLASNPAMRLRLTLVDPGHWYNVSYATRAIETMAPGESRRVPLGIANRGQVAWPAAGPRPVNVAYHWLHPTSGVVIDYEGQRTSLPRPVQPGEALEIMALVRAPIKPGDYLLAWDLVGEDVSWFSQLGAKAAMVPVRVEGPPAPPAAATGSPARAPSVSGKLEVTQPVPGRRALWGAALRIWRREPLLGAGPLVFQRIYGPEIGVADADPRYHTHNLLLEFLVGGGALGLAALLGLLAQVGWRGTRALARLRRGDERRWWWLLLSLAGWLAFLAHGMLDMFLAFTPTYLLFWVWCGMLGGLAAAEPAGAGDLSARRRVDADRL